MQSSCTMRYTLSCLGMYYTGHHCLLNPSAVPSVVYTKGALKVVLPILLCWPVTLGANAGDMAAEVEPSRQ
jgi:hypothetical protein